MDYTDMTYKQAEDVLNDTLHVSANDEMGGHAIYLASIALDKQTPKAPEHWRKGGTSLFDEALCPICGNLVFSTEKFCSDCGQALDWSEVKK